MGKKHKKQTKSEKLDTPEKKPTEGNPIKLVLKVGGADNRESVIQDHDERKHKHHKKKKKKKKSSERERHRHHEEKRDKKSRHEKEEVKEGEGEVMDQDEKEEEVSPFKKPRLEEEEAMSPRQRGARKCTVSSGSEHTPLQMCLSYLQRILQRKDVNGFFAFPVNDVIAPGYSSIIMNPMDFSTMKAKIDLNQYDSINDYKTDFKLMCDNCMVYNRPETVYYKAAQRLLQSGVKQMSKEKLCHMRRSLAFMTNISNQELGLEQDEAIDVDHVDSPENTSVLLKALQAPTKTKPKASYQSFDFEEMEEDITAEEILTQAQAAAKHAADKLTLRNPNSKIGFLRKRKDGSTTLNILNPDNDGIVSETERVVTLGSLLGKLPAGTGNIQGFREDRRNKGVPVSYLNYGPFSSHGPTYDSSFATLSKEDSDLLLSTYGDETGIQYAKSIKGFVTNCGDYTVRLVDNLLDVLTQGQHSKTLRVIEQKKVELKQKEEKEKQQQTESGKQEKENKQKDRKAAEPDFESLRSLSDLGIDVSFLDTFEQEIKEEKVQTKLNETAELIQNLQKTQHARLSQTPPAHLAHVPGPSQKEIHLAEKVTSGITELAKQVTPSDISSVQPIRSAMGVTMTEIKQEVLDDQSQEILENTNQQSQSQDTGLADIDQSAAEDFHDLFPQPSEQNNTSNESAAS